MAIYMLGNRIAAAKWSGQYKTNLALLKNVCSAIALAGLRAGIGHERHAKSGPVKVRRLAGISDIELDVIRALKRQEIALRRRLSPATT